MFPFILPTHNRPYVFIFSRYSASRPAKAPSCNHKTGAFQCTLLTQRDIKHFYAVFHSIPKKLIQDAFILKYTAASIPKRQNKTTAGNKTPRKKNISIQYFVKRATRQPGMKSVLPVCRQTFLGILQVSKDRVGLACKRHLETGLPPTEKRGGDTRSKKFELKRAAMKNFIETLGDVSELHYCRGQVKGRQYLPSDLNINKLWRKFNESVPAEVKVKKSYFRRYFCIHYNIGFGIPATDACSTCLMLKEQLKNCTIQEEKSKLIVNLRVHRLKAKAFFNILQKQESDELILSYDCQKNLPLPKLPDQATYFSRQLYMYNFTICVGTSHDQQNQDNTFINVWLESCRPKGSNEIASAIYNRLKQLDLSGIRKIHLVADGCGGQNKNSTVIGMVSYWLRNDSPENIKEVELVFPVVGHSFIPPDRVFGRIEKEIKKMDTIIQTEDYFSVFNRYGTVTQLGVDYPVYDWKASMQAVFKPPSGWHFKLKFCKRISIKKSKNGIVIRGEQNYKTSLNVYKGIQRKGKTCYAMEKIILPLNAHVKKEKLTDVDRLLQKHFGENWRELENLEFYKNIIDRISHEGEDEAPMDCICEQQEQEHNMSI